MRIYNRYILTLALLFTIINVIMISLGQKSLDVYFAVLAIASLVVSLLYVHFSPGARRALNAVAVAFFAGFLVVVALKVINIVYGA